MKSKPTVIQLILEGNPKGSTACWKSQKSANCQAETEWRDRTINMRMKPALVKQPFSGTYQGYDGMQLFTSYRMYPSKCAGCLGQRTDSDTSVINRLTNKRCIRQSITLVVTPAKWGLPKSERRKAMKVAPENLTCNGASVVVRARESLVHGEGKQSYRFNDY